MSFLANEFATGGYRVVVLVSVEVNDIMFGIVLDIEAGRCLVPHYIIDGVPDSVVSVCQGRCTCVGKCGHEQLVFVASCFEVYGCLVY